MTCDLLSSTADSQWLGLSDWLLSGTADWLSMTYDLSIIRFGIMSLVTANTIRLPNVGSMLAQRRRRRANIKSTFVESIEFGVPQVRLNLEVWILDWDGTKHVQFPVDAHIKHLAANIWSIISWIRISNISPVFTYPQSVFSDVVKMVWIFFKPWVAISQSPSCWKKKCFPRFNTFLNSQPTPLGCVAVHGYDDLLSTAIHSFYILIVI